MTSEPTTSPSTETGPREPRWAIRPARPADGPALREVLTAAGVEAWGAFLGAGRIEEANRSTDQPADLVAEDEHGVFAFVAWDAASGEISRLYTHPRGWDRGAGRALLERALAALKEAGIEQAWLNTEERNDRGCGFYERLGWRREGAPRIRDWHGVRLCEPRYVIDL